MKLLKRKPKLIVEFENARDRNGFYLTVKTQGDVCDEYVIAAVDYLSKAIKSSKKANKNGKNGRK